MLKYITLLRVKFHDGYYARQGLIFWGGFIDSEAGEYFSVCWKIRNTLAKHSGLKDCITADATGM
jgi:hypothetical protein